MQKKIQSALISVFYKDGLEPVVKELERLGIKIYSTGGTQKFIEDLGITCTGVENLTSYPSILGGRVKTLHPSVFGGILARRANEQDMVEMQEFNIPEIDLVIVDLYPFEETLKITNEENLIVEKIDIGGPSMIRAAAKNYKDVTVIASKDDYGELVKILNSENGQTTAEQRKSFAAKAFKTVMNYDIAISNYFNDAVLLPLRDEKTLRYGENPHQHASFFGDGNEVFTQLHGKELSYNNLTDVDAAIQLIREFGKDSESMYHTVFAVIKHTNVCGMASRQNVKESWEAALAGDPESAFGGVLICNRTINKSTAEAIAGIFFEVLIAPGFDEDALKVLQAKKNRILLRLYSEKEEYKHQFKSLLNGILVQETDQGNYEKWEEKGGRETTESEKKDLQFANLICKHLKSNAIAIVKNLQLVGKGCGQTSRIDALRQAVEKTKQFNFDLHGAVMASDAFLPFDDCVKLAHAEGIEAFIQPGGSIRDQDSIDYCLEQNLAMVLTGSRHFRH